MQDPLRLAVAPQHQFARRRVVALTDAQGEPFIAYNRRDYPDYHELLAGVFAGSRERLRIEEEPDGVSSLISALEAGNGVALVSDSLACIAGERVKLLSLRPAPAPLSIGIVSPKTGRTAAAEEFMKCARAVALRNRTGVGRDR